METCQIRKTNNKRFDHLNAYSLVELIVVMGIIGTLFGLSLTALVGLRESSRLNKNVQDFTSEAKTFLSRARNNVYDKSEIDVLGQDVSCGSITTDAFAPDAVGYYFDPSTKKTESIKCLSTTLSTQGNFCCTIVNNVNSFNNGDTNIEYTSTCNGVIFEYSTGQIYKFNPQNEGQIAMAQGESVLVNGVKEQCTVTIRNPLISYSKDILFDSTNNAIQVQ